PCPLDRVKKLRFTPVIRTPGLVPADGIEDLCPDRAIRAYRAFTLQYFDLFAERALPDNPQQPFGKPTRKRGVQFEFNFPCQVVAAVAKKMSPDLRHPTGVEYPVIISVTPNSAQSVGPAAISSITYSSLPFVHIPARRLGVSKQFIHYRPGIIR